ITFQTTTRPTPRMAKWTCRSDRLPIAAEQENIMKATIKYVAPWLAAAAIGAAVALAPVASAATHSAPAATATTQAPGAVTDTDPATPFGTDPESPAIFGYHKWLGDDVDVPF